MKFSDLDVDEQEKQARYHIKILNQGGLSQPLDRQWFAGGLCAWCAELIEQGKPLPPSLAKWLATGLYSAGNGGALEKALGLKKGKGRDRKHDEHLHIRFRVIQLRDEGMLKTPAIEQVAKEMHKDKCTIRDIVNNRRKK